MPPAGWTPLKLPESFADSRPFEAGQLAQLLELQNRERQQITQQIQQDAEQQALTSDPEPLLMFASSPHYNAGVVGLAASRLTEKYYAHRS